MRIIVAIDGFSSCGKSTMAKALAKYAGYVYVDTGAMYRATALFALNNGLMDDDSINELDLQARIGEIRISFSTNETGLQRTLLCGLDVEDEIRTLRVANAASRVSSLGFVRRAMVAQQQAMGIEKGIVMDGRDIATVVFPDAELKIFVTASAEERAKRRHLEIVAKGGNESYESVLENIKERDYRDTHREESPLYQAEGAVVIDNTNLTPDEQMRTVINLFNKAVNAG